MRRKSSLVFVTCTLAVIQPVALSVETCLASGLEASDTSTRFALSFCTHFQNVRCCLPVHDNTIEREFMNLMSSSSVCADMFNDHKSYLKHVMCAACNPLSPAYLSSTINSAFFSNPQTFKICASLAAYVAPTEFDQCGLSQQAYRGSICAPNNPVSAGAAWTQNCETGSYICQSSSTQEFSCQLTPCSSGNIPTGYANTPCSNYTCSATSMFLNDNGGAKPVFYEKYAIEIVQDGSIPCYGIYTESDFIELNKNESCHFFTWSFLFFISVLLFNI